MSDKDISIIPKGDWEESWTMPLFDQVKECGINNDANNDDKEMI